MALRAVPPAAPAKPTEGPYSVGANIGTNIYAGVRAAENWIGTTTQNQMDATPEELANARLFAASWELLAALKAARDTLISMAVGVEHRHGDAFDLTHPCAEIDAAIAKAEGR